MRQRIYKMDDDCLCYRYRTRLTNLPGPPIQGGLAIYYYRGFVMKKTIRFALTGFLLIILMMVVSSCSSGGEKKILEVTPIYMGEDITTTDHVFTEDDFMVSVSYTDGTDEFAHGYDIEVTGMKDGYYFVKITYKGVSNTAYVPCNVDVWPTDRESYQRY